MGDTGRRWRQHRVGLLVLTPVLCLAAGTGLLLAAVMDSGRSEGATKAQAAPVTFAAFGINAARDGTQPPPTPTPTPSPTPTPPPRPSSPAGLRVWADGDSTSYFISVGFLDLIRSGSGIQVQPVPEYVVSSGLLTGPIDWPAKIATDMAAYNPDMVVFMLGANDAVINPDLGVWRQHVAAVMDEFHQTASWVVWPGQPIMGPGRAELNGPTQAMNAVVADECSRRPWCIYVDVWSLTTDAQGNFSEYLPGPDGLVDARSAKDAIHFTPAGGRIIAQAVYAAVFGH